MDKPNGLYVIKPAQGEQFVADLDVAKLHGVGPVTEAKMNRFGIKTGRDLRTKSLHELVAEFGKSGEYFYNIARAIDLRPVRSERQRKSLGKETTFTSDICDVPALQEQVCSLCEKVWKGLDKHQLKAKTLTLKLKYANFQQITRAISFDKGIVDLLMLQRGALELLSRVDLEQQAVRLLGVTVSGFDKAEQSVGNEQQLELF